MSKAFYPGSFDPLHNGHMYVIEQAAKAFDEVVVAVAKQNSKSGLLSEGARVELISQAISEAGLNGVSAIVFDGLAVEAARAEECSVLVKGVRNSADLADESSQALINGELASEIPTVLIPAVTNSGLISSRYVRQVHELGGDLSGLVPDCVVSHLCG